MTPRLRSNDKEATDPKVEAADLRAEIAEAEGRRKPRRRRELASAGKGKRAFVCVRRGVIENVDDALACDAENEDNDGAEIGLEKRRQKADVGEEQRLMTVGEEAAIKVILK